MKDVTIAIPAKDEDLKILHSLKKRFRCPVRIIHDKPYGLALKQAIREAKTKYVLTMDGDGQHIPSEAKKLYKAFKIAGCNMMIGHRRTEARGLRSLVSLFFNVLASLFSHKWVVDLNSGMRIFKRDEILSYFSILCDGFSFTTSSAMCYLADNLSVEWFPIHVSERKKAKSHVNLFHAFTTLWQIIKIGSALRTRRIRSWWRKHIKSRLFSQTETNLR